MRPFEKHSAARLYALQQQDCALQRASSTTGIDSATLFDDDNGPGKKGALLKDVKL